MDGTADGSWPAIMQNVLASGEPLAVEQRGRADRARRGHRGAEPGCRRGVRDGPGDQAHFYCTWAGPLAHLHHWMQALQQRAVAAKRRVPGGAQRLNRAGAAEIEAELGLADARY